MRRRAVIEDDRGVHEESRDEVVPHHPAGRAEPEEPIGGTQVMVEGVDLEVLEEDPAVPVDDRLRQAGRARAVEHEEWMVEGHLLEWQLATLRHQLGPGDRVGNASFRPVEIGDHHGRRQARERGADGGHLVGPVHVAAAIPIAVDREEHLRLDLAEPIHHAARAELWRAARPDGAERGRGQDRDRRLGYVRKVGRDAIPAADAQTNEARPRPGDRVAQVVGRHRDPTARLGAGDEHRLVAAAVHQAEAVLGPVQPGIGEPPGARHACVCQRRARIGRGANVEVRPDR